LVMNDRKHVYKTFNEMMNMIETFGSVETP
jgi:hypothetical protein